MAVNVTCDKIWDHFYCHIAVLIAPRIEDAAPKSLIVCDGVIVPIILLAFVKFGVSYEHVHELYYTGIDHASVMPSGTFKSFASHALQASVEPVHDRQVGLAYPAVSPYAFGEGDKAAVFHDVDHHVEIVVAPDVPEVVHGVFDTAPFSVLIQASLVFQYLAKPASAFLGRMRFAVPEIIESLFNLIYIHYLLPSWIFLISKLSTNAWNLVLSWPEAELMYSFSIEQTGIPKSRGMTKESITRS